MTTLETKTLRPGLLVSLKTSIRGNVDYVTRDIEADHITETGERKAKWETERTVSDPAEHEAAVKARGKARSMITGVCAPSAFGLLCPQSRESQLAEAVDRARAIAERFNAESVMSKISVYVITGRVAADDAEAIRAINSEMRELLDDMEAGVKNLDAGAIREAANKARAIGDMLTPEAQGRMKVAIETVRAAARKIVKGGDAAAIEIDRTTLQTIAFARTSFLDTDMPAVATSAPEHEARALDFDADAIETDSVSVDAGALDIETPAVDLQATRAPLPALDI
jgi:hypothetical protein